VGVEYLQARSLMQQGRWAEAVKVLEAIRPRLKATPELAREVELYVGQCYGRLDEPAAEVKAIMGVIEKEPTSVSARLRLVDLHWASGRTEAAIAGYRQIMKLPRAPVDGWTHLARMLLLQNLQSGGTDWKEVEDVLPLALKARPNA